MTPNFDVLIVGCGLSGSIAAFELANAGRKVLIMERRSHIGGNMYDYIDQSTGLIVQKYGPHVFHTKDRRLFAYITRFCDWKSYKLNCMVYMNGKYTPSPFNYQTIDDFFSADEARAMKSHLEAAYPGSGSATIVDLLNHHDPIIKKYAEFLYANDYGPYTAKQWGIKPEDMDLSILRRVPVRLSYDNGYFDDEFQAMPVGGYTCVFEKLLSHSNIEVHLNTNALDCLKIDFEKRSFHFNGAPFTKTVIYTGALDELFEYRYGYLPYRSLRFEWEVYQCDSMQAAPIVAYPQEAEFTRITEYSKLPHQKTHGMSIAAKEIPVRFEAGKEHEPYYPVLTEHASAIYAKYLHDARQITNLILCGRLADFKYYNMDQVLDRALAVSARLIEDK